MLLFPESNPNAKEYEKFIGTFDGVMCKTVPRPNIKNLLL